MAYIRVEVDISEHLDEVDTQDLIDEIESRDDYDSGRSLDKEDLLEKIERVYDYYNANGNTPPVISDLVWSSIGKIL